MQVRRKLHCIGQAEGFAGCTGITWAVFGNLISQCNLMISEPNLNMILSFRVLEGATITTFSAQAYYHVVKVGQGCILSS